MKRLITLLFVIVIAVLMTTLAQGNHAKVAIFMARYRVDFSLNFAIVVLVVIFALIYIALAALRASGQLPQKIRQYWISRKQNALLEANTQGFIALITGDEAGADKSLKNAAKTGIETDLSYLIRSMAALQADDLDLAEKVLLREKAQSGDHAQAVILLKAKIALAKNDFLKSLALLDELALESARFPQVKRTRLLALTGLGDWSAALQQYRITVDKADRHDAVVEEALGSIYTGLSIVAKDKRETMLNVLNDAKSKELKNIQVLQALSAGLLQVGLPDYARKMLETALDKSFRVELISTYHEVAVLESQFSLPFVERLVEANPNEIRLMELAAEVCEREQLWGKAISRFEKVYSIQPSAHVAGKLERLYKQTMQFDKAKIWHDKLSAHLGGDRRQNS